MSMTGRPRVWAPAALAALAATTAAAKIASRIGLNRHGRGDVRVRVVILEYEVLGLVIEQTLTTVLDDQMRERSRLAGQLEPRLLEVVQVEMAVSAGPHEHSRLKAALARQHVG